MEERRAPRFKVAAFIQSYLSSRTQIPCAIALLSSLLLAPCHDALGPYTHCHYAQLAEPLRD
ncbi:MAG: hypothetical protein OHK0037_37520 [Elainellaceae cyanobacterium]